MILFHGTNTDFDAIDLEKSAPFKDFGRGFYLTSFHEQAEKMALRTTRFYGGTPTVLEFEAPDDFLTNQELRIKTFDCASEEWAVFIMNNRDRDFTDVASDECNTDRKYDIVYGPVGDDGVTLLLRQYRRGYIDTAALRKGLEFSNLSDQYSFHSERACALLTKKRSYHV